MKLSFYAKKIITFTINKTKIMNIPEEYFNYPIVFKFIIWLVFNTLGYCFVKLSLKKCIVPKKLVPEISDVILLEDGNQFDIGHDTKTDMQWINDILITIKLAMCQFYFANVMDRIDYYDPFQLIYIPLLITTIFLFGFMGEVKGMQTSCSPGSIKHWPLMSKIVYILVTIVLLAGLGYQIYLSYQTKIIFWYLISLVTTVLFYVALYSGFSCNEIHIHHWFIGYMLCYYFRFDDVVSNCFYVILYGIFLQGSVSYGITSIFKN